MRVVFSGTTHTRQFSGRRSSLALESLKMSLFSREFENDPFFSGTAFPSVFSRDPFQDMFGHPRRHAALTDGGRSQMQRGVDQPGQQLVMRDPFQSMMFPFGGMSPFGNMFQNMERMMQAAATDPNAHTFSSSSVMHYSSSGDGSQPKVYHATTSTRQAPGGIKETRKAVQDSESGTRKVAVGHHIGDRSHVIEKRHNVRTQEREEHQEFVNLDEADAGSFDREWTEKTTTLNTRYHPSIQAGSRHPSQSIRRGLPSTSTPHPHAQSHSHHHAGEKRKTRPPSLSHDSDDDVQIVGHHYSTGASQPRSKITAHERRDFSSRQPHSHVGEGLSSSHRRQAGIRPSETFDLHGRHGQTVTTNDHSHLHEHSGYDPNRYGSGSHSRHVGAEQFSTREPQQQQHHHQSRGSHLDPHLNSSSKKQKQKGERGVRFR